MLTLQVEFVDWAADVLISHRRSKSMRGSPGVVDEDEADDVSDEVL